MIQVTDRPIDVWTDEKLRAAGFTSRAAFLDEYGLQPYRLNQLYRAATKELVAELSDITALPAALREGLGGRGLRLSSVEPVVVRHSSDWPTARKSRPSSWSITTIVRPSASRAKRDAPTSAPFARPARPDLRGTCRRPRSSIKRASSRSSSRKKASGSPTSS